MKILFASDLHGTARHFRELREMAAAVKPGAILLGGDLFTNDAEIGDAAAAQRAWAGEHFGAWCDSVDAPVYWIAGNHEWRATVEPELEVKATFVHGKCVPLGDWDLLGMSYCSPTPYWLVDHERREETANRHEPRSRGFVSEGFTVREVIPDAWLEGRPTLMDELRRLPAPRDWRRTILMAHNPPFQSRLDTRFGMWPVGSSDIRSFILEKKPRLSLHGHIHEAPTLEGGIRHAVGETIGVNAGRAGHHVRAALIDLDSPELETKLLSGQVI